MIGLQAIEIRNLAITYIRYDSKKSDSLWSEGEVLLKKRELFLHKYNNTLKLLPKFFRP